MSGSRSILQCIVDEKFDGVKDLFLKTYPSLVSYASHYIGETEAENVVQDLYVYILENADRIRIRENLTGYLRRSVKNRCLTVLEKEDTHRRILSSLRNSIIDTCAELSPLNTDELLQRFEEAVNSLPKEQKEALELSRFSDMTYADIARKQGVSLKTVQYRVKVATAKLHALLSDVLPAAVFALVIYGIYPQ